MSTRSNTASLRSASSAITQSATELLTRPGRGLRVTTAMRGRGCSATCSGAASTGAAACLPAGASAGTGVLSVRALDEKSFLNQDISTFTSWLTFQSLSQKLIDTSTTWRSLLGGGL